MDVVQGIPRPGLEVSLVKKVALFRENRVSVHNVCLVRHLYRRCHMKMICDGGALEHSYTMFESDSKPFRCSEMGFFPGQTSLLS